MAFVITYLIMGIVLFILTSEKRAKRDPETASMEANLRNPCWWIAMVIWVFTYPVWIIVADYEDLKNE